jgi:pyruvate dehydrogenase E2 component (dihydrolipoamide acetyltransferase)
MSIEFKLPELGENIESADIVNVLVKPGDMLVKDQGVIEIETDKATIEVPSTVEGLIKEVLVKPGQKINVGAVLLTVDDNSSNTSAPGISESAPTNSSTDKKTKVSQTPDQKAKSDVTASNKAEKSAAASAPPSSAAAETKIVEFLLPELGENIESADVTSVLVKAGDLITKDQPVIEIETDKATIEVPSTVEGKIVEVNIKPGEKAKVGEVILKVETHVGSANKETTTTKSEPQQKTKPVVSGIQATKESSTSDKYFLPESGSSDQFKPEGGSSAGLKKTEPGETDDQPPILKNSAPAAPSVRRIARELGVDIRKVSGTGSAGRISMDDVKAYVKRLNEERDSQSKGGFGVKQESLPDFSRFGSIERKPMNKIRTITAEHLSYAWNSVPHVTQFDKADISILEKFRKSYGPKVEKAGGKLTVTSVLIKIVSLGLEKFPQFNSSIDMQKKEVIYKNYFNVGVAVDTERGLIVPVLKDVDKKDLTQISVEMNQLAEKARNKKIDLDDLSGGCFTITNLGGIGGTSFTPIVNTPEVAILGVSRGAYEQVYNEGAFIPKLMLPLSLSYDHRIIDGADAARFLRWVCEVLEQPFKLID